MFSFIERRFRKQAPRSTRVMGSPVFDRIRDLLVDEVTGLDAEHELCEALFSVGSTPAAASGYDMRLAMEDGLVERMGEFAKTLGSVLRRPAVLPVPLFALRLALGEAGEALIPGQHVIPEQAEAAGYAFRFPELRRALEDLL